MQFLLIYVIAGIVVYIYYAEKIQRDFDCMYTGGKNFLANVIAVMLVVVTWPYILWERDK